MQFLVVCLLLPTLATALPEPSSSAPDPPDSLARTGAACSGASVRVDEGDTCESIAQRYEIALEQLLQANPVLQYDRVCKGLPFGMVVCIPTSSPPVVSSCGTAPAQTPSGSPSPPCEATYVVRERDTCVKLCVYLEMGLVKLLELNPDLYVERDGHCPLQVGQTLCIKKGRDGHTLTSTSTSISHDPKETTATSAKGNSKVITAPPIQSREHSSLASSSTLTVTNIPWSASSSSATITPNRSGLPVPQSIPAPSNPNNPVIPTPSESNDDDSTELTVIPVTPTSSKSYSLSLEGSLNAKVAPVTSTISTNPLLKDTATAESMLLKGT
ncbi:hypothetical protein GGR50DRAFT_259836 [Xylaria sp. CBS 124048]|nr:hypothetical protein GGR50DRAFT_259836 [Xylaria sp. CBS 124048]